MRRGTILLVLGVLVALSPFIGLPYSWLMVILPLLGVAIVVVPYLRRKEQRTSSHEAPPIT